MVQGLDRALDRRGVLVGKSPVILLFNLKLMFTRINCFIIELVEGVLINVAIPYLVFICL